MMWVAVDACCTDLVQCGCRRVSGGLGVHVAVVVCFMRASGVSGGGVFVCLMRALV